MARLSFALPIFDRWERPRTASVRACRLQPGRLAQGPEEKCGQAGRTAGIARSWSILPDRRPSVGRGVPPPEIRKERASSSADFAATTGARKSTYGEGAGCPRSGALAAEAFAPLEAHAQAQTALLICDRKSDSSMNMHKLVFGPHEDAGDVIDLWCRATAGWSSADCGVFNGDRGAGDRSKPTTVVVLKVSVRLAVTVVERLTSARPRRRRKRIGHDIAG